MQVTEHMQKAMERMNKREGDFKYMYIGLQRWQVNYSIARALVNRGLARYGILTTVSGMHNIPHRIIALTDAGKQWSNEANPLPE